MTPTHCPHCESLLVVTRVKRSGPEEIIFLFKMKFCRLASGVIVLTGRCPYKMCRKQIKIEIGGENA